MRKLLFILFLLSACIKIYADGTHDIEPSLLEVHYAVSYESNKNEAYRSGSNTFVLRCGKNTSQYFCYENIRHDSLSSVPGGSKILFDEIMEWTSHKEDISRYPTYTPSYRDCVYIDMQNGDVTIYTSIMGERFKIQDNPKMEWRVVEDSVKTILGHECQMAETDFRGRHWKAWFAIDIPLTIGPWKFNGLPGLILQAECPDFLNIECFKIMTRGLTPVKFYNYYNKKATDIDRAKFINEKAKPGRYPKGTAITPSMELE